ncbi:MAG: hypothetical protein E6Q97_20465 [Desulfurellales bacterium]|nr:MAG: hypothetical protein E6Q97_20465 [Desulfurellales bacterium]
MSDEKVFTEEERAAASHLKALVDRQIDMGNRPELALAVLTSALGSVACEQGLDRAALPILFGWVESAFDGAAAGKAAREADNAAQG